MAYETGREPGYTNWKPNGSNKILLSRVWLVLEEFEAQLPLTCRQILYVLLGRYEEYTKKGLDRPLSRLLTAARRTRNPAVRHIPFEAVRDDGVVLGTHPCNEDLEDFLEMLGRVRYNLDRQSGQKRRVEVWCEAGGMVPQLKRVTQEFTIPTFSCSGFNSIPSVRQVVDRVQREGQSILVLHLGDYDPSGLCIHSSFIEDCQAFLAKDAPGLSIDTVRVALTPEQIAEHKLPWEPLSKKDPRYKHWAAEERGDNGVQLEALPPDVLAKTLREEIRRQICLDAHEEAIEREKLERAALKLVPRPTSHLPTLEDAIEHEPVRLLYPPRLPCGTVPSAWGYEPGDGDSEPVRPPAGMGWRDMRMTLQQRASAFSDALRWTLRDDDERRPGETGP